MLTSLIAVVLLSFGQGADAGGQERQKNVWEDQYKNRPAADMAAQFEQESRPVFRHRAEIVRLLELSPGVSAAEIGAGSGFLSRLMAREVGPTGRVVATELDPKMVGYMNDRARSEGLANLVAIAGRTDATGLDPGSMDAIVLVNTYSFFDRPGAMMRSIASAMKPGGLLVIVDILPSRGSGVDPERVKNVADSAGFMYVDWSEAIPGHFTLRLRKRQP